MRSAPTILQALRLVAGVVTAAADDHAGSSVEDLRLAASDRSDAVAALAAVHALGALPVADAATLVGLLASGDAFRVEHAAWALARSAPVPDATPLLVDLVAAGGVTGMLAQRTLERWAPQAPEVVLDALSVALERPDGRARVDHVARTRLVETAGLVPGAAATALLLGVVDRGSEAPATGAATTGAPSTGAPSTGAPAVEASATVAAAAAALGDWFASRPRTRAGQRGRGHAPYPGRAGSGLTVAQLFLHADIDGELSSAGKGDTGGIATLLVHLGNALLESGAGVERVVTISRGRPGAGHVPDHVAAPATTTRRCRWKVHRRAWPMPGCTGSPSAGACDGSSARRAPWTRSTCGWPTWVRWPLPRLHVSSAYPLSSRWRPTRTPCSPPGRRPELSPASRSPLRMRWST